MQTFDAVVGLAALNRLRIRLHRASVFAHVSSDVEGHQLTQILTLKILRVAM